MRLLVVSHFYPLPANNGSKMRIWAVLRALAAEGHDITLLTFANPGEADGHDAAVREACREVRRLTWEMPSLSSGRKYAARFKSLFSSDPFAVSRFRSEALRRDLADLVAGRRFDAIICEEPYLLTNFPASLPAPLVIDNHNLEHVILQRFLQQDRNPARRLYAWLEGRKLKAWEQQAWRRAELVTACSEHDRCLMQQLCPALSVAVVPNVIDLDAYTPAPYDNGQTVLYAGGMDWYPNRDAVEYFISDILPELRHSSPGIRFEVAGRNAPDDFEAGFKSIPEVRFTGAVPDMQPVIARAMVCVVPLRIGSGTRLKILEAAAMAKPIVSTRVGAEGLDFVDGEEIILADQPQDFARAVASLLAEPNRRKRLGEAARHRVERQYGLPALRKALREVVGRFGEELRASAIPARGYKA